MYECIEEAELDEFLLFSLCKSQRTHSSLIYLYYSFRAECKCSRWFVIGDRGTRILKSYGL